MQRDATKWVGTGLLVLEMGLSVAISACRDRARDSERRPQALTREDAASLAEPRIGGAFTRVGDFTVELVVHRRGTVEARLARDGVPLLRALKFAVSVSTRSGASEPIELTLDRTRGSYVGHAQPGVELRSAPVEITLDAGAGLVDGKLGMAIALEPPRFDGDMLAAGAFGAEVILTPDGFVHARLHDGTGGPAGAGAKVEVRVRTVRGGVESVALRFDATRGAFLGKLAEPDQIAAGPLLLRVRAGGNEHVGALGHVAISEDGRGR